MIAGAGLVSLLAVAGFTLFLSGRMKSVAAASVTAFVFLVLPVIFYMMLGNNLGNWIRCLLPAGGVGMVNSFTYAALNTDFAYVGNQAVWLPCVMMTAAAAEAVLFTVLGVAGWCRKK